MILKCKITNTILHITIDYHVKFESRACKRLQKVCCLEMFFVLWNKTFPVTLAEYRL